MFPIVMKSFKFKRSLESSNTVFWEEAINDEMNSLISNKTWKLVNLLSGCKTMGCKQASGRNLSQIVQQISLKLDLILISLTMFFPVTKFSKWGPRRGKLYGLI